MKTKLVYPAFFTYDGYERCYHVEFIDFSCETFGKTIEEAYIAAQEEMEKYFSNLKIFPARTEDIASIKTSANTFISFVTGDLEKYYKKHSNKVVKKTLTIPEWLNELALEKDINFSHVLQEALKEKLQIK